MRDALKMALSFAACLGDPRETGSEARAAVDPVARYGRAETLDLRYASFVQDGQ